MKPAWKRNIMQYVKEKAQSTGGRWPPFMDNYSYLNRNMNTSTATCERLRRRPETVELHQDDVVTNKVFADMCVKG
jgi:hypothetical protein